MSATTAQHEAPALRAGLALAMLASTLLLLGACSGGSAAPENPNPPGVTPVATAVAAGNNQSGTAGAALATRPSIRVTDQNGGGVTGMVVTFSVVSGGGTIADPVDTTDAQGVATAGTWTLGGAVGQQQLVARTPGLPEVTFVATAAAPSGSGTLTPLAGTNNQTANAGSAVANAPAVTVRNGSGQAVPGVSVAFAVASGGGTLQVTSATSDAQGVASAGRWTLGSTTGTQTVTASASGYTSVTFSATSVAIAEPSFTRTVLLGNLQNPWDVAFTPDGTMLYTERGRGLSVRLGNGTTRLLWRPTDMVAEGQSGMLGVAVDPQFASNRTIYVYMASNLGGATANRVLRGTVDAGFTAVANRTDIVTGITYAGGAHSGGRIRFGPDGFLYITTGDTRTGSVPQNLQALGGKVLRVTRDGTAAPGNNPPAGADPRIFTYGHRNVQGITFRPGSGTPFISEHGPGYNDEVTRLSAGGNGGWHPLCSDNVGYCGYDGQTPMTNTTRYPQALRATWSTGSSSLGMSGSSFISGTQWRAWDGALAVTLLGGRRLEILRLNTDGSTATNTPILNTLNVRLRGVTQGPDGALYVMTDQGSGDEIWRVVAQ